MKILYSLPVQLKLPVHKSREKVAGKRGRSKLTETARFYIGIDVYEFYRRTAIGTQT